jgi:hypothetical protein
MFALCAPWSPSLSKVTKDFGLCEEAVEIITPVVCDPRARYGLVFAERPSAPEVCDREKATSRPPLLRTAAFDPPRPAISSAILDALFHEASAWSCAPNIKSIANNSPVAVPPQYRSEKSVKGQPPSVVIRNSVSSSAPYC